MASGFQNSRKYKERTGLQKLLIAERGRLGMNQEQFADFINATRAAVNFFEGANGEHSRRWSNLIRSVEILKLLDRNLSDPEITSVLQEEFDYLKKREEEETEAKIEGEKISLREMGVFISDSDPSEKVEDGDENLY